MSGMLWRIYLQVVNDDLSDLDCHPASSSHTVHMFDCPTGRRE